MTQDAGATARGPAGVPPTRVLLADLEGRSRTALAHLIAGLDGATLVGEVGDHDALATALRAGGADVLIVDDRLLRGGEHVLSGLGRQGAGLRVIVLGMDDDPGFAARARRLGAETWVAKDRADDELPELLRP